jgi:hypothetical protein
VKYDMDDADAFLRKLAALRATPEGRAWLDAWADSVVDAIKSQPQVATPSSSEGVRQ